MRLQESTGYIGTLNGRSNLWFFFLSRNNAIMDTIYNVSAPNTEIGNDLGRFAGKQGDDTDPHIYQQRIGRCLKFRDECFPKMQGQILLFQIQSWLFLPPV